MVCANTINETFNLTKREKNQLKKYENIITYIANSKNGRRYLVQDGAGFISFLLPIVARLIGEAINGANAAA